MAKAREVRTEHVGGELLLVDFGAFAIVSDHPESMGGTGKGPMPGELLKGALAASALLAMAETGIALDGVEIACGSETMTERREDGPLPSLTVLSSFVLAVSGEHAQVLEDAARGCPVARMLTGEVAIIERNVFLAGRGRDARSTTLLIESMKANRPAAGETTLRQAAASSQVTAEWIGQGRLLLHWARASLVVGGDGATPEQLVLAALCACTSVFSARAAAMVDVAAEIGVTCSAVFDGLSVRIDKAVAFRGQFDAAQREVLAYCADNCAIGETLRRQARIDIVFGSNPICDDGACCIAPSPAQA